MRARASAEEVARNTKKGVSMKNAKKILLLVLSLVLLIGVFAVATFAEAEPTAATVTYPDGTVVAYTAAGEIQSTIVDGLYYGKGNTLYKDNSGNGWIYTDAAGNAVTAITEEMISAGAKITATGLDQVYSTIDIQFPSNDYYKYIQGASYLGKADGKNYYNTVYAPAGCTDKTIQYPSKIVDGAVVYSEITVSTTKRPTGNFTVYFYDAASLENFFSSKAAVNVGGVICDYQDLRTGNGTKHTVKLYADHTVTTLFNWTTNDYDRMNTGNATGQCTQSGSHAKVYFDMNGHSITATSTEHLHLRELTLYLYSSKPGAHFFVENAPTAIYLNNNATLYLGSDADSTTNANAANMTMHVRSLFRHLDSGGGVFIRGGHYYQTDATASYLVAISGRLKGLSNASFFVKDGVSVFGDKSAHNDAAVATGGTTIWKCNFYSDGSSLILDGTKSANLKFDTCSFNGVSTDISAEAGKVTKGSCSDNLAVTYKTVTFFDGTKAWYYATTLDAAKTFVEGHPFAKAISPYAYESGNSLYYVANPKVLITYDDALNALVTDAAKDTGTKVYYSVEQNGAFTYYTNAATHASEFVALMGHLPAAGANIVLCSDITVPGLLVMGTTKGHTLDINGYRLTITSGESRANAAMNFSGPNMYVYSSREGGVIDGSAANGFFWTNDDEKKYDGKNQWRGTTYFGESSTSGTAYGKNLTVYCQKLASSGFSGAGLHLYGGTFVQTGTAAAFVNFNDRCYVSRNSTFVLTHPLSAMMSTNGLVYSDCTFVYEGDGSAKLSAADYAYSPKFYGCNFVNIIPTYNEKSTPTYDAACSFGTTSFFPTENLNAAGAAYLAHTGTKKSVTANGVTYSLDGALVSSLDGYSAIIFKNAAATDKTEYWANGIAVALSDHFVYHDLANECTRKKAFVASLENGVATVAFESNEGWAFSYLVGGVTFYVTVDDCGNTEEGVGNAFYDYFAELDNTYVVTLYSDLLLTKGMGMGEIYTNSNKKPEFASMQKGDFTLDMNGHTIKTSDTFTYVDGSNSNGYGEFAGGIFCFEVESSRTFKITSSRPGARFEHNDNCAIFLIGEYGSVNLVIDGANITFDSLGAITHAYESTVSQTKITIDGGTYIYRGNKTAFGYLGTASIKNAEVVLSGSAPASVFSIHTYKRNAAMTVENLKAISLNKEAALFRFVSNGMDAGTGLSDYTYSLKLTNCSFSGISLASSYTSLDTLTYTNVLSTNENYLLAAYGGAAPADKVLAFSSDAIGGYAVKLLGYYTKDMVATVNWGFGMQEYWVVGATATHENAVIDGIFTYAFKPIDKVASEGNKVTFALRGVENGVIQMSLTLQSYIGMNVTFGEKLQNAIITVDGKTVDASQRFTMAIAPNVANQSIIFTIQIGDNTHIVPLGIDKYAKALINSETQPAEAKNLAYAMVEYVRVMTGDEDFCNVEAPEGYTAVIIPERTPTEATGEEKTESGYFISFNLDSTIAIAVTGGTTETVTLKIANRELTKDMEGGMVVFEPLAVNELDNVFSVTIGETTYEYSLVEYYYAMPTSQNADVVKALYNYAHHAKVYVIALQDAANGNAENA